MGQVKAGGGELAALVGLCTGKAVGVLCLFAHGDVFIDGGIGQVHADEVQLAAHIPDGLCVVAALVDSIADGDGRGLVAGSAVIAGLVVRLGQAGNGGAHHRGDAAFQCGLDVVDVKAVGKGALGLVVAVGVGVAGGLGLFVVVAKADEQELVPGGIAQCGHRVGALQQGGVVGHAGKVLAGCAGNGQIVDVGVKVVLKLLAVALAGEVVAVVEGGDGGVAYHPEGGLGSLCLTPHSAARTGIGGSQTLGGEQQQAVHINAAVCVAGGGNGGIQTLEPALLHRDGVGGFVVAGLGLGVPVEVVRAVDSGAALALECQLLLAVRALAEGNDAIGGVVGHSGLVAGVQCNVVALVVVGGGVVHLHVRAGVGIDALGGVVVGDGVEQLVVAGQVGAAHLEAVAVACFDSGSHIAKAQVAVCVTGNGGELQRLLFDRLCSQHQVAVFVGDAVLDGDSADGAGGSLGKQVPAVVGVVGGDAAVKYVALAGGQLGGKAVGILHGAVGVVHGGAVLDGVVAGPQSLVVRRQAGDLQAGVAVVIEVHLLQHAMAAGQLHALGTVLGVGDVQLADVPIVAPDAEAGAYAAKVQRGVAAVCGGQGDGSLGGAVAAALYLHFTGQGVGAACQLNGLACGGVVQRSLQVYGVRSAGAVVGSAAVRGDHNDTVCAQCPQRDLLFNGGSLVAAQLFKGADHVVLVRGEHDLKGGVAGHGVAPGQGLAGLDGQILVHKLAVGVHLGGAVRIGLEGQCIAAAGAGRGAGDLVYRVDVAGGLQGPLRGIPCTGGVGDVGEGHIHAAGSCKAQISLVCLLHGHGVVQLSVLGNAGGGAVLCRDVQGRRADHRAGGAVRIDGVLGGNIAVAGLGQTDAVGVALLDGLAAESGAGRLDIIRGGGLVGDDAGVAAHTHGILDLYAVQRELGTGDRDLVGEVAAGTAQAIAQHQRKALLSVRGGVDVVDGHIGLQIEVFLGGVDGGVVEGKAVSRGVSNKLAALFVDGAVLLDGAGVQGDFAVDVCTLCKGVDVCCCGGAEGLELPAVCRGVVLCKCSQRRHAKQQRTCQQPGQSAPDGLLCFSHGNSPFPYTPRTRVCPCRRAQCCIQVNMDFTILQEILGKIKQLWRLI